MSRGNLSDEEKLLRELRNLKQFPPMPGVPENAPGVSSTYPSHDAGFGQAQFLRFSGRQDQPESAAPGVTTTRTETAQAPDFIFGTPGEEPRRRDRSGAREPEVPRQGIPIEVRDASTDDSDRSETAQVKELLQRILVEIENLPDEIATAFGVDL